MLQAAATRVRSGRAALVSLALAVFVSQAARAQAGWGIAKVGDDFYFSDLERGRIVRLDERGRLRVLVEDIHTHNLAPAYDGAVLGEAVGTGAGGVGDVVGVWRIVDDRVDYPMPLHSRPQPGVWVTGDAEGNSYAWHREGESVSRIVRRSATGEVTTQAGGAWGLEDGPAGQARFGAVGAISAARDGTLYVTDSGHLRVVTRAREVRTLARMFVSTRTGGLPGDFGLFNHSVGLVLDDRDNVFAVDAYNLRVVRWHQKQGTSVVWSEEGWLSRLSNNGLGWRPRGVAVDDGEVYVLVSLTAPRLAADLIGSPRILRVRADGATETVYAVASTPLRVVGAMLTAGLLLLFAGLRRRARRRRERSLV
jgi:hypothetical protein